MALVTLKKAIHLVSKADKKMYYKLVFKLKTHEQTWNDSPSPDRYYLKNKGRISKELTS